MKPNRPAAKTSSAAHRLPSKSDLVARAQREMVATEACAFTSLFLRLAAPEDEEVLERAGRVLFTQAFFARDGLRPPSSVEEAQTRYQQTLDELSTIAGQLHQGARAGERFAAGELELGYYAHASATVATRLSELVDTAPEPTRPDQDTLELLAESFPEEPSTLHFQRALSALRLAVSSLEKAVLRFRAQLAERASQEDTEPLDGRLVATALLALHLENHLHPALTALQAIDGQDLASTKKLWAVGPWEVLHTAAVELMEIHERLRTAAGCLSTEELATRLGADLSLAALEAGGELMKVSRALLAARDRTETQALGGLSSRTRLALHLECMAETAAGWRRELEGCVESVAAQGETVEEARDTAQWLEAELAGRLGAALGEIARAAATDSRAEV